MPQPNDINKAQQIVNKANDECTINLLNLELMGLIKFDKNGNIVPTELGKNYVMLSEDLKSGLDKS